MSNVNGYFATPAAPQAPQYNAQPGQPQPTVVNVNNYQAPGAVKPFGLDQYGPEMQQLSQIAQQAAPYAAPAAVGLKINGAMAPAKAKFSTAARSSRAATKAKNVSQGRSLAFGGIMNAVKSSVIFNGILSLAMNGYKVFTKQQTVADGGANVTGDVASAAVGGAAGAVASAAGTALLGSLGLAGLPLTLLTVGLGVGGYLVADTMFRKTNFFQTMTSSVRNALQGLG